MRELWNLTAVTLLLMAPGAARAGYEEGVAAFRSGDYAAAARELRLALEAQPEAASVHYMLGASLFRLQRLDEAVASLSRAVELAPGEPAFALTLAQARLAAGDPRAAFQALSEPELASLPEKVRQPWIESLAAAAQRLEMPSQALTALEAAAVQAPDSAPLQQALGRALGAAGRPAEAFAAYARAYELEPANAAAARRGVEAAFQAAEEAGEDPELRRPWYLRATGLAEELATAHPSPDSRLLAGEAWMGAGEYARARSHFQASAGADPEASLPRYYLGRCAVAEGEAEEALLHLDAALERTDDPELESRVHRARGTAYHTLHRFDLAAAAYRVAGDDGKAAEMERLGELAGQNRDFDRRRAECLAKLAEAERIRAENRDLAGTADWRVIEQQIEALLADCRPYLTPADGSQG